MIEYKRIERGDIMRVSKNYNRVKKIRRRRIGLAVILVLLSIAICYAVANKFILKNEDVIAKNEQEQKAEIPKENLVKVDLTAYKKGTSHNNEASEWAYSIVDVDKWMKDPSTYKGKDKLVFLTFDDGPSELHSNAIMDAMKNYGVHGTFFIIGRSADQPYAKAILQREMAEGHSVGLHSYSHEYSFLYPHRVANVNNIVSEVDQNIAAIRKSLGADYTPTVLRFPGGHMSWKGMDEIDSVLDKRNIHNIDWNVLTGDAEARGSRRDLQGALQNIKEDMAMYGNPKVVVILMHDIKQKSADALPSIIEYYQSMGYKFGILN